MNYTSIEQSKHLLELGLSPESADMMYVQKQGYPLIKNDCFAIELDIPCWTAEALLNLMPPYLFEWERGIDLQIYPHLTKKHTWLVSYIPNNVEYMQKDKFRQICHADTLVEAAYNMVVWLLENNYIEKGE